MTQASSLPPEDNQPDDVSTETGLVEENQLKEIQRQEAGFFKTAYVLAWKAMLFQEDAYTPIRESAKPFRKGFGIILVILLTVSVSYLVGVFLNFLTLPRIDLVQDVLFDLITGLGIYQQTVANSPGIGNLFEVGYGLVWQAIRIVGGFPSWLGAIIALVNILILGILNWLGYGLLVHMIAGWLGGKSPKGPFFGALALAYAPVLITVVNLFPGLTVPANLVFLWTLVTCYQVIKSTYNFSWARSAIVTILPYPVAVIGFYIAIYGGIYLGVAVYKLIA